MRAGGLMLIFSLFLFNAFADVNKKEVRLSIIDTQSIALGDETIVYLDYGTTPAYAYPEDSRKVFNPSWQVPQIFAYTSDGVPCSVTGYGDFTSSVAINIGFRVDSAGTYTILPSNISNFDPTSIIRLKDLETGVVSDLRQGGYAFTTDSGGVFGSRFQLLISYPPQITSLDADCADINGGISVYEDSSLTWSSTYLYDSAGTLIGTTGNIMGSFAYNDLAQGGYTLYFNLGGYSAQKSVTVTGHQISLDISLSVNNPAVGQEVQLFSSAQNASQYEWWFSDGSIITGSANPPVTFYEAGDVTVILRVSNTYGCSDSAVMTFTVGGASGISAISSLSAPHIFSSGKELVIQSADAGGTLCYSVNNLLGQQVNAGIIQAADYHIDMTTVPDGVYVATVLQGSQRYTQKVYLHR